MWSSSEESDDDDLDYNFDELSVSNEENLDDDVLIIAVVTNSNQETDYNHSENDPVISRKRRNSDPVLPNTSRMRLNTSDGSIAMYEQSRPTEVLSENTGNVSLTLKFTMINLQLTVRVGHLVFN